MLPDGLRPSRHPRTYTPATSPRLQKLRTATCVSELSTGFMESTHQRARLHWSAYPTVASVLCALIARVCCGLQLLTVLRLCATEKSRRSHQTMVKPVTWSFHCLKIAKAASGSAPKPA